MLSDHLISQFVLQSTLHVVTLFISQMDVMLRTAEAAPCHCLLRGEAPPLHINMPVHAINSLMPVSSQPRCTNCSFLQCTLCLDFLILPQFVGSWERGSRQDLRLASGVLWPLSQLNYGLNHTDLASVGEHLEATLNLNGLSFFNFQIRFLSDLGHFYRFGSSVQGIFLLG